MDSEKIPCQICGAEMHQITYKHLKKHNLSLEQYKQHYPNAPTRSQYSLHKKSQSAKRANASRKGVKRDQNTINKISERRKGQPAWNKGKKRTGAEKQHQSQVMRYKYQTGQIIHPNTGKHHNQRTRDKISDTLRSQNRTFNEQSKQRRQQTLEQKKQQGWVPDTNRQKAKQTQLERYGGDYNQQHIPQQSLQCLNDHQWLYEQHYINQRSLSSLATELSIDQKTVSQYLYSHGLETQHHMVSDQEQQIRSFIDSLNIPTICNTRKIIPPYEIDIFIPQYNLAIEYCGLYWHSEQAGKDKWYHYTKWKRCHDEGIQLVTIFEDEWINTPQIVKNKLMQLLSNNQGRVYARNTVVQLISTEQKKQFFNENHIQGDGPSSINLGLFDQDRLVACCGFSTKERSIYYLTRYATNMHVVGGFSKLVQHFIRHYQPTQIISFADLRWSNGNLYNKTGWQFDKQLDPDYTYVEKQQRIHKFNFRRKYLPTKLDHFEPKLSERENCDNNNVPRVWDCGKLRYVFNLQ